MKRVLISLLVIVVSVFLIAEQASAGGNKYQRSKSIKSSSTSSGTVKSHKVKSAKRSSDVSSSDHSAAFPEKGWHKGFYLTGNVGMMQVTNDKHSITNRKFDGTFDMAFGLSFGWDITDWIGPMVQLNYATATGQAGDPNNDNAAVTYNNGTNYPAGTFPTENAREHAVDVGVYVKATHPYFTRASWQPKMVKILPYLKLGGIGNAVFINAPTNANKAGAFGGGIGVGGGVELYIWKGLYVGLDVTEGIIFQKGFSKTLTDSAGNSANTKITEGGTKFQFNLMGMFGWHF